MLYQDLKFHPHEKNYAFDFRLAWFEVEEYENRIYAFENEIPYAFSIPAYYKKGIRFYINCKMKLWRATKIYFRISDWIYSNSNTIGSGNYQAAGYNNPEIAVLLKIKI